MEDLERIDKNLQELLRKHAVGCNTNVYSYMGRSSQECTHCSSKNQAMVTLVGDTLSLLSGLKCKLHRIQDSQTLVETSEVAKKNYKDIKKNHKDIEKLAGAINNLGNLVNGIREKVFELEQRMQPSEDRGDESAESAKTTNTDEIKIGE